MILVCAVSLYYKLNNKTSKIMNKSAMKLSIDNVKELIHDTKYNRANIHGHLYGAYMQRVADWAFENGLRTSEIKVSDAKEIREYIDSFGGDHSRVKPAVEGYYQKNRK